jgi:hypothetical protein
MIAQLLQQKVPHPIRVKHLLQDNQPGLLDAMGQSKVVRLLRVLLQLHLCWLQTRLQVIVPRYIQTDFEKWKGLILLPK